MDSPPFPYTPSSNGSFPYTPSSNGSYHHSPYSGASGHAEFSFSGEPESFVFADDEAPVGITTEYDPSEYDPPQSSLLMFNDNDYMPGPYDHSQISSVPFGLGPPLHIVLATPVSGGGAASTAVPFQTSLETIHQGASLNGLQQQPQQAWKQSSQSSQQDDYNRGADQSIYDFHSHVASSAPNPHNAPGNSSGSNSNSPFLLPGTNMSRPHSSSDSSPEPPSWGGGGKNFINQMSNIGSALDDTVGMGDIPHPGQRFDPTGGSLHRSSFGFPSPVESPPSIRGHRHYRRDHRSAPSALESVWSERGGSHSSPPSNGGDNSDEEGKRRSRASFVSSNHIRASPRMTAFDNMSFRSPNWGTKRDRPASPHLWKPQSPPRLLMPDNGGGNLTPNFAPPTINAPEGDGLESRLHIVPVTPGSGGGGSLTGTSMTMASTPPLQFIASSAPWRDSSPPHSTMAHSGAGHLSECTSHATTMTSPDSGSSSREYSPADEEGLTQHLPLINLWSSVPPDTRDIPRIDANFRYRAWFTWHLIKSSSWNIAGLGPVGNIVQREAEFWKSVSRADPDEDIWFWEDEDEDYIKAFIEDHPGHRLLEMSEAEWRIACLALRTRDSQHQHPRRSGPVSRLTPEPRLHFMAWLVVAAVYPKAYHFRPAGLHDLLQSWSHSIGEPQLIDRCAICQVSAHINLWVETMLHVYSVDDLQSIPWDHPCSCFHK